MDAKGARPKKKGLTPTKAPVSHPSQWAEEDIDIVRQTRYKMDLQHFQTYRRNKIDPGDMVSINTKDHSAYIEVAWADPGSVIRKSVFSVAAYREVLNQKGGDVSRFDKEVESMFKKGPRGSRAPDATKVPIKRVMLVCQRENRVNVKYSYSDGFGRPGTMGLWDLHSSDTLNRAKMQLPSGSIDANFCPCCAFYSNQKGGDVSRFDKEVESMFKKGPRGSRAPDATKVPIKRVMLVCQRENRVNVKYSYSDGFGRPGTMGLWDLHSSDALNRAKMQLPSGSIDANFCPCCTFYSTNNETLNNHVRKHYGMGLTCRSDGFMTASVAAMKGQMETEHRYEGKHASAVKKPKGKG